MRRSSAAAALALVVLAVGGCALLFEDRVPAGAYFPDPRDPDTGALAHVLWRAALAAGDDPARYSFARVPGDGLLALADDDAVFYFSDALLRQPPAHVDALVAQGVAHEVLGHVGERRALSIGVSVGFTALGVALPGLGLADLLVNPLVVRAFSREQELAADRRAVAILRMMGHDSPRRTLAAALRAAAARNGPPPGGPFAKAPDLAARLAALEPLEPVAVVGLSAPVP